jgi:two-component system sensor histidine kinase BaeS
MRNKLFFAFLAVVLTALISNLLYEYLITRDFEDYVSGTKEDKLYWVLASVEGSYEQGHWDRRSLHDAIHWGIMLGFDLKVLDSEKREILNSDMVISMLAPAMKRKMKNIDDISSSTGDFEPYPLYHEGIEVGTMLVRQIDRPLNINRKELMFKRRGMTFLLISFAIAGGGAILLSIFFTLFLSRPLKKMRKAVQAMGNRDFSVRMPVISRDEIGSLSESFNFMAEALEREEALRKHLTSNIAHELRTPLSVMKANVEAMLDGVIEDNVRGMKNIQTELEKLIRLVQGIEDITKAEASFFAQKDHVTVSLRDFLSAIGEKMMPLASAKGLEIEINGAEDTTVHTDADKLERILQNILSNAIKNTQEGRIVINYGTKDEMFFVRVKDTGPGIGKEELELIFNRFYHGPESGGLGLGLAIVKELLDVMGGHIDVESRLGEGSTFTIWLPGNQ